MDTEPPGGHKPTFLNLVTKSEIDIPTLNKLTGIPRSTIRLMLIAEPMPRAVVYKVLSALSDQLHHEYTPDNTDIPLIPTFSQTLETLNIIPSDLAGSAEIDPKILQLMIDGRPVFQEYAERFLRTMSAMTEHEDNFYNFENVDVNILMAGVAVSDVARIKQEIEATYEAAQRGLTGLSEGSSRHPTITKRMEDMTYHLQTLEAMIGEKETMQFLQQVGE